MAKWTPTIDKRLGTVPDKEIAEKLGVSVQAVYQRRRKLEIAASKPRENEPHVSDSRLKELRGLMIRTLTYYEGAGASRRKLAELCKVSPRQIARYLDGEDVPPHRVLELWRVWLKKHPLEK